MTEQSQPLPSSVGQIAARFGVGVHQVEYVLRTRQLKPVGRVANAWLCAEETVLQVGEALARIAARRVRTTAPATAGAVLAGAG